MYEFNFDDNDLQANRAGHLTPHQRERVAAIHRMRQSGARWTLVAFLIFIPSLLGVGLLNEFGQSSESSIITFLQTQLPILCLMSGLFTIILGGSAFTHYLASSSARRQHITAAEGQAHIINVTNEWRSRYSRYELHLRRQGFSKTALRFTTPQALRYFHEGRYYRVYYIEYYPLPIPLSAEEIRAIASKLSE